MVNIFRKPLRRVDVVPSVLARVFNWKIVGKRVEWVILNRHVSSKLCTAFIASKISFISEK